MARFLIATFSHREDGKRTSINGMIEPMLSYLLPKNHEVDLLDGFHPGSSGGVISLIEIYKNKKRNCTKTSFVSVVLSPLLLLQNQNGTQIFFKLRDFLAALEWGIRAKKRFDYFIGLESVYTLAGIILRKLGVVKIVIYYVSDYSPNRYPQKWFNNIYVALDRFCARYANFIWDVSPAMQKGRIAAGLDEKKSAPVILVSNALFPNQIFQTPVSKRIPYSLVYAGTLGLENGPDIAIRAVKEVLKKFPKTTLHVFGGNKKQEEYLQGLAKKSKIDKHIVFHSFISDSLLLSKEISHFMVGLAPYRKQSDSVRLYGDATKLRLYMGVGIPVITTSVPPLGEELEKKGCAVITDDTASSFAKEITKLFQGKEYERMQKRAMAYGKQNTWENTYTNAFARMKIKNVN